MKKVFIICSMLLLHLSGKAQNEPYYGGNGDGNALGELSLYNDANPSMFYAFFGGNGDGHSTTELSLYNDANPPMLYAYFGGDGDGNTTVEQAPYVDADPPMFYAYFGGDGDGYSTVEQMPYVDANPPMFYAYFGGDGDGFAGDLLPLYIPAALPVNLLSFDGKIVGEQSLLQWKVAMEKNISHYNLQRSAKGKSFSVIYKQVATTKNGEERTYDYTDAAPMEGANYYRLEMVNDNGKMEYSQVVLLYYRQNQGSVVIYPNPAQQTLNVRYSLKTAINIKVMDVRGATVLEQRFDQGNNTVGLSIGNLAAGMYMLQINGSDGYNQSLRFVKQ